ncbi:MAG TPA: PAAR domain-containing protein [Paucimonas sp.]|nr:PAAR domain-containing protein [Paucimonas sp.]
MPSAARLADICTGHGSYGSRPNISGSPDVFINNLPAHRTGDAWMTHNGPRGPHGGVQATGSPTVFVNGRPLARVGDLVSCGSIVATGSGNVFCDELGCTPPTP